jgi:hypothetical protein
MKIGFNPLRDMLLAIVAMSMLVYFLYKWKASGTDILHHTYLHFDSSEIKGVVESIHFRHNMESVKVDNSDQEYLFAPNITDKGVYFHVYTEIGDSIIKPPFSKVVTVKGKGESYTYTFKNF